jgi:(p)ppGpp synthase/HD superfamily hydrolase
MNKDEIEAANALYRIQESQRIEKEKIEWVNSLDYVIYLECKYFAKKYDYNSMYVIRYTIDSDKVSPFEKINTLKAIEFAIEAHKNQKRKYTNEPYWVHLAQVAGLVSTVRNDNRSMAVAWLHDCIEDCGVTFDVLKEEFGWHVANGVQLLSDLEEGNRETRKRLSRERLAEAPDWVQDIKVCDLISNTESIVQHDPEFAKIYIEEKRLLLDVLTKANPGLLEIARKQIIKNNS